MATDEPRKHRLTPRGVRANRLREFGVPPAFISTIKRINKRRDRLGCVLGQEDAAYFYLMTSDWDELDGAEVTPLATGCNGDTFFLALTHDDATVFVYFSLEGGVYERFETFDDLIKYILEDIACDMESDEDLMAIATDLGYSGTISLTDLDY